MRRCWLQVAAASGGVARASCPSIYGCMYAMESFTQLLDLAAGELVHASVNVSTTAAARFAKPIARPPYYPPPPCKKGVLTRMWRTLPDPRTSLPLTGLTWWLTSKVF